MRNNDSFINPNKRLKQANKTTLIGALLNIIISIIKVIAGIIGHSQAMIADGIHSLSDLGSDIVVIIGMFLATRPNDMSHNYGHGKFETLSTLIIAIILTTVGIGIGSSSIKNAIYILQGNQIISPQLIAFIAALFSIILKELLFRYTLKKGKRINSTAVIANAYHHRSDAFSSIGTAIGIGGAILLGNKWVILDPIAGVIVSVLIIKEAIKIGKTSLNELLEFSLPTEIQERILQIAKSVTGVYNPHNLKTRQVGNISVIDLHICINPTMSVQASHSLTHEVESSIRKIISNDVITTIHVEPYICNIE
jgi:cation diffusion facilitator family transporter